MDAYEAMFKDPKFLTRLLEFLSPQTEHFRSEVKELKKRVDVLEQFRKADILEEQ